LGPALQPLPRPVRRARARVGRARGPRLRARPLRHGARAGDRAGGHRDGTAAGPDRESVSPFTLELGLGAVALLVFGGGLIARGPDRRWIAWLATAGILLFGAFELMSIPLYVLAGFLKRQDEAVEAALKFFLVGSVSAAVMAYGLSFVYGAARTTDLARVAQVFSPDQPLLFLGLLAVFA